MEKTVIALAAELCGASEEDMLLRTLCDASETLWKNRAKAVNGDCGDALRCAAAFTAAAD